VALLQHFLKPKNVTCKMETLQQNPAEEPLYKLEKKGCGNECMILRFLLKADMVGLVLGSNCLVH